MKYAVTLTREEPAGGVVAEVYVEDRMLDALKRVDDAEFNGAVFLSVTISPVTGSEEKK